MHYHYTLLAWHFFLFSINYMVKFACKRHFRAFSLEIKILLLPFYFEFLVLQECKVVFRECITLEHNLLHYIHIYCQYLKVNIFPSHTERDIFSPTDTEILDISTSGSV